MYIFLMALKRNSLTNLTLIDLQLLRKRKQITFAKYHAITRLEFPIKIISWDSSSKERLINGLEADSLASASTFWGLMSCPSLSISLTQWCIAIILAWIITVSFDRLKMISVLGLSPFISQSWLWEPSIFLCISPWICVMCLIMYQSACSRPCFSLYLMVEWFSWLG